jgi:hypothetical protein
MVKYENEIGGTCSIAGKDEKCIQNLVRKSEGKKSLGRQD